MDKVFLGGSRRVSRLNDVVRKVLATLVGQGCEFLVGDANGADKAFQKYFADTGCPDVTVYCSGEAIRNNLGGWITLAVEVGKVKRGFDFYAAKDRMMARDSSRGFVLWDGESKGTLRNIIDLLDRGKPVQVYFAPDKEVYSIGSRSELRGILAKCDRETLETLDEQLKLGIVHSKQEEFVLDGFGDE